MSKMKSHIELSIVWLSLLLVVGALGVQDAKREVYIVYMGAIPQDSSGNILRESHLQLLSSVLNRGQRAEDLLVRRYMHGFSGFAARLSNDEALALRRKSGVVSVFADPIYQLHTTRSWDFLEQTSVEIDDDSRRDFDAASSSATSDTIIGLLDTGIWPESASFSDDGFTAIPSRWKGVCVTASDFNASNCNKKLIGARYYQDAGVGTDSPRDDEGHGTHTSSTAAGNAITTASYYGLASGTAKGGSTTSRVAMYRVCAFGGCAGSAILAGFDDAIADGVDLLSISIGASAFYQPDFSVDPIAIGAFHAVAKGITVVCSAGNDGPMAASVVNSAPWILTVAATTIDRYFESDVLLGGNNTAVRGEAINFSGLDKSPKYPLIYGAMAKSNSTSDANAASHCEPGTLDSSKIKGKIVLCNHSTSDTSKDFKATDLQSAGAVGAIFIDDVNTVVASTYNQFAATEITSQSAMGVLRYINSTKNPVATITPTITVTKHKPAPVVVHFSSRGPSAHTANILKPDIAAPGVNILASWIPASSSDVPTGQKPSQFNLVSGTSMACPHVAGVAATIKAWNPTWSSAAIRSAIMTTATHLNSDKDLITTDSGMQATAYDYGAGEVNPTGALEPGLVYELATNDYLQFLCNYGYNVSTIKLIATIPDGFKCASNSSKDLISDLNYPSIAVSNFSGSKTVNRAVTNVGSQEDAAYTASINSPSGLDVKVIPNKLQFTKNSKKLSFQVIFSAQNTALKGELFGSIIWSDGTHLVRSPFVLTAS